MGVVRSATQMELVRFGAWTRYFAERLAALVILHAAFWLLPFLLGVGAFRPEG